ncbi:hypothetical protein BJY01DRAFT_154758 [Aspergillus pseudoustus]|uniref:Short chain oxidoreductase/dehydrogenase n=1 Tax=Aspergillus pseudoustus TaxID=1810923 RepID=A0ABR4ID56_9EURO
MAQTWFITGASSGFGLDLALVALKAGHRVIGTVRCTSKSASAVAAIKAQGGHILELDVTKADHIPAVVKQANAIHGGVDILVNNAGYSLLGAVEDMKEDEVKLQMETNFFGPLRLIRALLPTLRARGTMPENNQSTIVNISSVAGHDVPPSCGLYSASKFALEGLSDALALETAAFNINVLIVEPGAFRTNFLSKSATKRPTEPLSEPYRGGIVDETLAKYNAADGRQRGDPRKAVERVFEVVTGTGEAGGLRGKILRLPLGPDCVERLEGKIGRLQRDLELTRRVAMGTDFD